jgi:hypothetical protein
MKLGDETMKNLKHFICLCSLSFLVIIFTNSVFSSEIQRTALVIGNSQYKPSALRNSVNDAVDMAAALKRLGFAVTLVTDANLRNMEKSVAHFGRQLHKGGVGLFYYAGHGMQVGGRNYLIPLDAVIESESDVKYESMDVGRVLGKMEDAHNDINIIILDACRDNPFGRGFRSYTRGLARIDAPSGSILAYATAPGDVAADGSGRNGLYTSKLLHHITAPGTPIEQIFKNVRKDVVMASHGRQVPWESSSLIRDFYFVSHKKQAKATKEPVENQHTLLKPKELKQGKKHVASIAPNDRLGFQSVSGPNWEFRVISVENTGKQWWKSAGPNLGKVYQIGTEEEKLSFWRIKAEVKRKITGIDFDSQWVKLTYRVYKGEKKSVEAVANIMDFMGEKVASSGSFKISFGRKKLSEPLELDLLFLAPKNSIDIKYMDLQFLDYEKIHLIPE